MKYGGPSPKRTYVWSNSPSIAGFCVRLPGVWLGYTQSALLLAWERPKQCLEARNHKLRRASLLLRSDNRQQSLPPRSTLIKKVERDVLGLDPGSFSVKQSSM